MSSKARSDGRGLTRKVKIADRLYDWVLALRLSILCFAIGFLAFRAGDVLRPISISGRRMWNASQSRLPRVCLLGGSPGSNNS
jgi:hypothetical protein